jgi:hypothetical protein
MKVVMNSLQLSISFHGQRDAPCRQAASAVACNRPCVVVAGGREPSQWEAYPHHQYIHMNGTLSCCANGGCWKSRTIPLGDGDSKDNPENLCVDVVDHLPRCMDMITAEEVIRRIKLYFDGGVCNYLTSAYARITKPFLLRNNIRSHDALIK